MNCLLERQRPLLEKRREEGSDLKKVDGEDERRFSFPSGERAGDTPGSFHTCRRRSATLQHRQDRPKVLKSLLKFHSQVELLSVLLFGTLQSRLPFLILSKEKELVQAMITDRTYSPILQFRFYIHPLFLRVHPKFMHSRIKVSVMLLYSRVSEQALNFKVLHFLTSFANNSS